MTTDPEETHDQGNNPLSSRGKMRRTGRSAEGMGAHVCGKTEPEAWTDYKEVRMQCWAMADFCQQMHWERKWQSIPVFLPGESQGRGSLVGCRLWGLTELDMTETT